MREPWFWRSDSLTARAVTGALFPLSLAYHAGQRLRWAATRPAKPAGPVICIGNATLGGVGKTPFAILVHRMLSDTGITSWFLTRGYGGHLQGPARVDANRMQAAQTGDEALLLAREGPAMLARNRPDGARAAFEGGADAVIMDDGFQNPTLRKTVSILLIDAADPEGNGRIFPAGPLREPVARARTRADIIVAIKRNADAPASNDLDADFHAWLEPSGDVAPQRVVAFTGIGVPSKFFMTLTRSGFDLAAKVPFADHHPFTAPELAALRRLAKKENATLITTEKDYVRLPQEARDDILTLPVTMRINAEEDFKARLLAAIDAGTKAE